MPRYRSVYACMGVCVQAHVTCDSLVHSTHAWQKGSKILKHLKLLGKRTTVLESHTPSVPLVRERPLAPHGCTNIRDPLDRTEGNQALLAAWLVAWFAALPAVSQCLCCTWNLSHPDLEGLEALAQLQHWLAKPATSPCTSASSSLKWELWPL